MEHSGLKQSDLNIIMQILQENFKEILKNQQNMNKNQKKQNLNLNKKFQDDKQI